MKLQRLLTNSASAVILGAFALAASVPAYAGPVTVDWTWWNQAPGAVTPSPTLGGSANGALYNANVTYIGQTNGLSNTYGAPTNYPGAGAATWTPASSWTGSAIADAPPTANDSVALTGGVAGTETIYFSSPVVNPYIAIWSLGDAAGSAAFDFTSGEPFTILAGGPSTQYPLGIAITSSGEIISGTEGSGLIQLWGTYGNGVNGYAPITFSTPTNENYYAFTVGEATPEPETLSLLGLGLLALPLLRSKLASRRRA